MLKFNASFALNFLNAQLSSPTRVTSAPSDPSAVNFARIFTHITTVSSITIGLCVATTQCYAPKNVANLFNVSVLGAMLLESAL